MSWKLSPIFVEHLPKPSPSGADAVLTGWPYHDGPGDGVGDGAAKVRPRLWQGSGSGFNATSSGSR